MNDRLINATGPIPYGLTNDCMFHFVFQKDIKALKSLVCSVLHLEPADVNEIEVCNPIEIGHAFDSKKFHLDLKVKFNNNTIVNLETNSYWIVQDYKSIGIVLSPNERFNFFTCM